MPLFRIYSIYDEKAEDFSPPFFSANDRLAQRMVKDSARGNGSMLGAYPEDFKIYRLGEFNSGTGQIGVEKQPVLIMAVKSLLREGGNNVEN